MSPERVSARLFTVVRGGILRAKAAQARRGLRKALGSTVLGSALALGFLEQAPLQELFGPAAPQHRSRRSLSDKILQPIQRKPAGLPDHVKRTLSVQSLQELQDLLHSIFLSEGSYKVVDLGTEGATEMTSGLYAAFPPQLLGLTSISWCLPDVNHRYLIAEAPGSDAIYVAFMGTKVRRDLATNANVIHEAIWPEVALADDKAIPKAHRGFLGRAREVPVEALFLHASRQRKRLVFCGHSLGAAVAVLSTIRLLQQLPTGAQPAVSCLTFACPAIGNVALAEEVAARGWSPFFKNLLVPEDIVPRLLTAPDVASAQPWTADDFPAASKEDDSVAAADSVQPAAEQCAASAYDAAQPSAASTSAADPEPMTASAAADSTAHSSTQQIVWPDRPGVVTMQTLQQLTALWKRRRGQQQQAAVGQAGRGEDAAPAADQAAASQSISDSASFAAASCADDGAADETMAVLADAASSLDAGQSVDEDARSALQRSPSFLANLRAKNRSSRVYRLSEQQLQSITGLPSIAQAYSGHAGSSHDGTEPSHAGRSDPADGSSVPVPADDGQLSADASSEPEAQWRFPQGPGRLATTGAKILSRTAGAGMRGAARIMGSPITAARRTFFSVGPQYSIFPHQIIPCAPDTAALPYDAFGDHMALPEVAVEAAAAEAARSVPGKRILVKHKMSFHRARIRAALEKAMQDAEWTGVEDAEAPQQAAQPMALGNTSPHFLPKRAEAFLPWSLPGSEDVKNMLEDLGSLSGGRAGRPVLPDEQRSLPGGRAWAWLQPWAWISGLAWGAAESPKAAKLTLQVFGEGLHNARTIQVVGPDGQVCPSEILHRPKPLEPAQVHLLLGFDRPLPWHQASRTAMHLNSMLRRGISLLDRTNSVGVRDCLLVQTRVPAGSIQTAGAAFSLFDESAGSTDLAVVVQSDFQEVRLPLKVHGGASWVVSDLAYLRSKAWQHLRPRRL